MYSYSSYVSDPLADTTQARWHHPFTGQTIGMSDKVRKLLPDLLKQQTAQGGDSPKELFRQLLAKEFEKRGFLIPEHLCNDEDSFLNRISPVKLPKHGFFHCSPSWTYALPDDTQVAFLGAPTDLGASKPGCRFGPDLIRERSLAFSFRGGAQGSVFDLSSRAMCLQNLKMFDLGNVSLERANLDVWLHTISTIYGGLPSKTVPILVGGDHTLTLGAIDGLWAQGKRNFSIVQLDSHLDLQLWGEFEETHPKRLDKPIHSNFMSHIRHRYPDIDIFQLGVKNFQSISSTQGKQISHYLREVGTQITDLELLEQGPQETLSRLGTDRDIYLTIDIDVLSHSLMPFTGYPASIGLPFEKLYALLKAILKQNRLIGVDIMEFGSTLARESQSYAAEMLNYLLLLVLQRIGKP